MRVIAGEFRSRLLQAPRGLDTRPTSDRLRETLFNVLGPAVAGARFLDLYAGSGAVGIEALSRGALQVVMVEEARPALAAMRANLESLGLRGRATIDSRPVDEALAAMVKQPQPVEFVFLDPPYEADEEYQRTLQLLADNHGTLLAAGARVVAEHTRKKPLAERYGELQRTRVLLQGDAALSFFQVVSE